ncbi:hypothetical protein ABNIH4_11856, partial [Acinetobacter baumannii ABNIH4]
GGRGAFLFDWSRVKNDGESQSVEWMGFLMQGALIWTDESIYVADWH